MFCHNFCGKGKNYDKTYQAYSHSPALKNGTIVDYDYLYISISNDYIQYYKKLSPL